jgi:hypothetical protein
METHNAEIATHARRALDEEVETGRAIGSPDPPSWRPAVRLDREL